jgi:hypothetical protein
MSADIRVSQQVDNREPKADGDEDRPFEDGHTVFYKVKSLKV